MWSTKLYTNHPGWCIKKKKNIPSHGVVFSTKAAAQVATKGILHISSFRTLEILKSASLCLQKMGGRTAVDGCGWQREIRITS
jgi:hypothetical protein